MNSIIKSSIKRKLKKHRKNNLHEHKMLVILKKLYINEVLYTAISFKLSQKTVLCVPILPYY